MLCFYLVRDVLSAALLAALVAGCASSALHQTSQPVHQTRLKPFGEYNVQSGHGKGMWVGTHNQKP